MKTSNKLLIAFAAALILLPILGMVYVSRVNYKVGTIAEISTPKPEDFSTPTRDMTATVTASFISVNIADAQGNRIGIRFLKDEKSGVKIPTQYKDLISAKVDANGQLQLTVKKELPYDHDYISIFVYAPALKAVNVNHAQATYLSAVADSINFNVTKTSSAGIGDGSKIGHLNFIATGVAKVELFKDEVSSLRLTLDNSNFRTEAISYTDLAIATSGICNVEVVGNYDDDGKDQFHIQNLNLNTLGKTDLKIINLKVNQCTGSLSDDTNVQMPAANIKQMFRK